MMSQCLLMAVVCLTQVVSNNAWMPFVGQWDSADAKRPGEEVLDAILSGDQSGQDTCLGQRCASVDQCCKSSACVQVEENKAGTCLPIYSQCARDGDCDQGFRCVTATDGKRTCDAEREMRKKQFNDECTTSRECDTNKGLCCQLQRRHRMAPRKICYYFADPQGCIGDVDNARGIPMNFVPSMQNPLFKARLG